MYNKAIGIISTNYQVTGLGTLSTARPAGVIPFGGRYRLIDFALSSMVNSGISTVGIITPYWFRPVLDHIGSGKAWNLDRKKGGLFFLPGPVPDLQLRIHKFCIKDFAANIEYLSCSDSKYVVISGCNHVCNMDYREMIEEHERSGADVTLACKLKPAGNPIITAWVKGDKEGKVTAIVLPSTMEAYSGNQESYHFADTYIINRERLIQIIEHCENMEFTSLLDVIASNLNTFHVRISALKGYWETINSLADYYKCSMDLLNYTIREELFMGELGIQTRVKDNPSTQYGVHAQVSDSLVSSGCRIEGEVTGSILFRGVTVEAGASVKNCIIMQKGILSQDGVLENVICDKEVYISKGAIVKGQGYTPLLLSKKTRV
ncbi:MAG: glucose-1-phosphate adenylyltransferase subunit GlgD [Lachnospiraceae bacterium]